jgi:hypothetical protein
MSNFPGRRATRSSWVEQQEVSAILSAAARHPPPASENLHNSGSDPPFLINLVPRPDARHGSKYSVPTDQGMEERCCDVHQDGGEKHVGEHCVRHSQDRVQLVVMG